MPIDFGLSLLLLHVTLQSLLGMNDRQRCCPYIRLLANDDGGSAAIEYAILACLIAAVLVSVVSDFSEFLIAGAIYIRDELLRITSMPSS